jgi:AcrR family transcriptional regulator
MAGPGDMRDRILDATECLLTRLGYRKMTMDDVAQEAGIGKRTIYVHFPSKEEVALASIDRVVDRLTTRLRELAQGAGPPDLRLRRMLLCRILFRFDSVQGFSHRLDGLFESLRPAYMSRRCRYFEAEASIFNDVLTEGRDAGFFACDDPLAMAHTMLLATNSLLPYSLNARELGRREEVEINAGRIADLLLNGIRQRPPSIEPKRKPWD